MQPHLEIIQHPDMDGQVAKLYTQFEYDGTSDDLIYKATKATRLLEHEALKLGRRYKTTIDLIGRPLLRFANNKFVLAWSTKPFTYNEQQPNDTAA